MQEVGVPGVALENVKSDLARNGLGRSRRDHSPVCRHSVAFVLQLKPCIWIIVDTTYFRIVLGVLYDA